MTLRKFTEKGQDGRDQEILCIFCSSVLIIFFLFCIIYSFSLPIILFISLSLLVVGIQCVMCTVPTLFTHTHTHTWPISHHFATPTHTQCSVCQQQQQLSDLCIFILSLTLYFTHLHTHIAHTFLHIPFTHHIRLR